MYMSLDRRICGVGHPLAWGVGWRTYHECESQRTNPAIVKSIIYKLIESFWVINKIISIQVGLIIRSNFFYELAHSHLRHWSKSENFYSKCAF